jgi:hypothetical protein
MPLKALAATAPRILSVGLEFFKKSRKRSMFSLSLKASVKFLDASPKAPPISFSPSLRVGSTFLTMTSIDFCRGGRNEEAAASLRP